MSKYFVAFLVALILPVASHADEKRWVSMGRLLFGGTAVNLTLNGKDIPEDFYGTVVELIMSSTVLKGAEARTHALHPDLPLQLCNIKAGRLPKTRILMVSASSPDPAYTQAYLDAVMDEFIAYWKQLQSNRSVTAMVPIQDEMVRLEKDMDRIKGKETTGAKQELERLKKSYDTLSDKLRETYRELEKEPTFAVLEHASKPAIVQRNSVLDLLKK